MFFFLSLVVYMEIYCIYLKNWQTYVHSCISFLFVLFLSFKVLLMVFPDSW